VRPILLGVLLLFVAEARAQQPLDTAVRDLASQITTSATKQEKQRIAVLPFRELDGQPTVFGTYLAEELVTNLFQLGNFKIVERQLLDKVMGELKIQRSGAIDPATAKEIGRIAAVDAIVTGSITELDHFVAINCRLIDTTTGEVFGAAQTKIAKDTDVGKLMNIVVSGDNTPLPGTRTVASTNKTITTKDLGTLRVSLKSISPVRATRGGRDVSRLRWTFELSNREAKRAVVVAMNGEPQATSEGTGLRFTRASSSSQTVPLRASVLDDHGSLWKLNSHGLGGVGFVRAGVHGKNGDEAYGALEIVKLLHLRDQLGRDTDDPADGFTSNATSVGKGGSNVTFGSGRVTSPPRFFRYRGNRFISGSTVTIEAGQSIVVTMDFESEANDRPLASATSYQFNGEIIAGVEQAANRYSYALHHLTFDRVSVSAP
jgi:curli biogenesis system outer membrane secretion channel CsgG